MGWRLMKCPACGSNLNLETDRDYVFCQYCGAKLHRIDNRIVIEHIERKIDETENLRIDFETKKFEDTKKSRKYLGVLALVFVLAAVFAFTLDLDIRFMTIGPLLLLIAMFCFFAYSDKK